MGRSDPPPSPIHGMGILLSRFPDGYIYVGADYDTLEWETSDIAAMSYLEWAQQDEQKIVSVHQEHLLLNELPTTRLIVQYMCPNNTIMIEDRFIIVHAGTVYEIFLLADMRKYDEYKTILERLSTTFRVNQPCKYQ